MYYRRKILLSIIQEFDNKINATRLQKILFLFTRSQKIKAYDFVPYKFGCYSFQAVQDLNTLTKYNIIKEERNESNIYWKKKDIIDYSKQLIKTDYSILKNILNDYKSKNIDEIIKHTYINYPYYALNSSIKEKLLNKSELKNINIQKRKFNENCIASIGYEGISLENYLNKLIINDIRILIDVRKNALSQKYGFSKNQLRNACLKLNIDYLHFPELGIQSSKRKELNTLNDYKKLFDEYERNTLQNNLNYVNQFIELISKYKRIAITCFEKDINYCHRGLILNNLNNSQQISAKIIHL